MSARAKCENRRLMQSNKRAVVGAVALLLLLPLAVHGGGVVTNCTESNLRAAMVGGGTVTFACDGTITLIDTSTNPGSSVYYVLNNRPRADVIDPNEIDASPNTLFAVLAGLRVYREMLDEVRDNLSATHQAVTALYARLTATESVIIQALRERETE